MLSNESIKRELALINDNQAKLYSFLYNLVYKPLSTDTDFLEKVYNTFLTDSRSEIRRIAIYSLLFGLKVKKERYKNLALLWASSADCSEELRLFSMSGLGEAYAGTTDPQLLLFFFNSFNDMKEEDDLRAQCFIGMMKILGLSSVEIVYKNQYRVVISFDDINIESFRSEIDLIKEMLS